MTADVAPRESAPQQSLREFAPRFFAAVTGPLIAMARETKHPIIAELLEGIGAVARDAEAASGGASRSIPGNWTLVPAHLRDGLDAHIGQGRPTGGFLTAVLSNDLHKAVGRADDISLHRLHGLMIFLHQETPDECWGSPERVSAWRAHGGLAGRSEVDA